MDDLRTALFRALRKSDVNMLRAILAQGVPVGFQDGDPYPVFHAVIICGGDDLEILDMLLTAGADPRAAWTQNGTSVLHYAGNRSRPDILNWFLAQGVDVNAASADGTTPLMSAITAADWTGDRNDYTTGLRDIGILLAAGADAKRADQSGGTALHSAVMSDLEDVAARLLDHGAEIEARNAAGETPLLLAVSIGADKAVACLLARGANPGAQGIRKFGALHDLASRDEAFITPERLEIVERLITAGLNPDMADDDGRTALCWAASSNNIAMAKALLHHGANANACSGFALREAVFSESDAMVDCLLAAGAGMPNADFAGDWGDLPLAIAASIDYAYGIAALLDHGADIDAQTIDGETALLVAVRNGSHAAADLLLARGANRDHADRYGNTALGWATRRQDAAMIGRLK